MLLKLSWRNLWRNRRRSLIVLAAIVLGLIVLVLTEAYTAGMLKQMLDDQIGSHVAHMLIHKKGFNDNKIIQNYLPSADAVESALERGGLSEAASRRIVAYGLASSASNSSGVSIVGVEPEKESRITLIKSWVVEGSYLSGGEREIVIGRGLAERLGVELGGKIVLMSSAKDGTVGSDVFRIIGLYESSNGEFDKAYVYIKLGNAQRMLGLDSQVNEIAVLARNPDEVSTLQENVKAALGDEYEVLSYDELLPALMAILEVADSSMGIYYLIIGIATIFGIINTLLMSVFERIREFGVLMAMGMKNKEVFSMVLMEALLLGVIGTVAGLVVGMAIYVPMWTYGLDLSSFSEGLKFIGVSATVYPLITPIALVRIILIIPFISVLASVYPAVRAIRLVPVRAIYYI